jgi:uncharacterized protein (DUF2141 family)
MVLHRKLAIALFSSGVAAGGLHGLASAAEPADAPDAARTSAATSSASRTAAEMPAADATDTLVTLQVGAVGFDDDRGHAIAMLFRPGSNVLDEDEALGRVTSEIQAGAALLRFPPVREGTYALVVFHDTNDNGIVDHNFFHIPAEQLGFSNGFRPGPFAGLPTFEKLRFRLQRPPGAEPVVMKVVVK